MDTKQVQMLELAGRVQYITINNVFQAGIFTTPSQTTARRYIKDLVNFGLLDKRSHGVSRVGGKLPTLYTLTPKAKTYLVNSENNNPEEIKIGKSNKNQTYETETLSDYWHRTGLVDSVLSILLYLDQQGIKEDVLELYFRRFGIHEPKRTALILEDETRLEPDAILSFKVDGKPKIYLIEFYEDSDRLERIKKSMFRHAEALGNATPSTALNIPNTAHKILMIFRYEHTARAIMEWLHTTEYFEEIQDYFLFKTLDSVLLEPFDHWALPNKRKTTLYKK